MSTFKMFDCDMNVPCDTFQCHGRAKFFLGKEHAPKSTLTKVCQQCANELIEDIVNSVEIVEEPFDEPVSDEFLGKPVVEWTVAELKEMAAEKGISGASRKNKAQLIRAIEDSFK